MFLTDFRKYYWLHYHFWMKLVKNWGHGRMRSFAAHVMCMYLRTIVCSRIYNKTHPHVWLKTYQCNRLLLMPSWNNDRKRLCMRSQWTAANEEQHLPNTFHLSACDWIRALSFQPLTTLKLWLCSCDFKTTSGGRGLSLNLPFSLHCARVFATVKQTQSRPNPNLSLVKISHFFFRPILSKLVYGGAKCLVRSDLSPVLLHYPRLTKSGLYN